MHVFPNTVTYVLYTFTYMTYMHSCAFVLIFIFHLWVHADIRTYTHIRTHTHTHTYTHIHTRTHTHAHTHTYAHTHAHTQGG